VPGADAGAGSLTEVGLVVGGHRKKDRFWRDTLPALANRFGVDAEPETSFVCVDKRRQWGRARKRAPLERVPLESPHRRRAAPEAQVASRDA
jgi:hypothetical protein